MQYGRVYVYNKNNELIAVFDGDGEGRSEDAMREMQVAPVVTIESNGVSTLSFTMLANSSKWQTIKDPENVYYVNGRYYTALTENAYTYSGKDTARIVEVTLVETWALLKNKYIQAYNCGIYVQAKGTVRRPTLFYGSYTTNLYFEGKRADCSNLGNTITANNAFDQVNNWERKDKDGNLINYRLIPSENMPENAWIGAPQFVNITRLTNVGSSPFVFEIENPVKPIMKVMIPLGDKTISFGSDNMTTQYFSVMDSLYDYFQQKYGSDDLKINSTDYYISAPQTIKNVELTYTTIRQETESNSNSVNPDNNNTASVYSQKTYTEKVDFEYFPSTGLKFKKPPNYVEDAKQENVGNYDYIYQSQYKNNGTTFQYLTVEFEFPNMGAIKQYAELEYTLAYGAEVVDEHTFLILPKADTKYRLTINGATYSDSQVKDSRGVVMPRGSGGYAMWAALKDTDWTLGVCDVIAKNFNASNDYGCFNVETDMKDVLTIIQNIQSLYGGILDWDSENKILNYRAENSEDYQTHDDDFNKWKGIQFRQGKNLTEQPTIIYDNDIITKAYLLGYGNLNVKKVNGDKSYITDYSYSKATYEGYLTQELIYDTNDEGGQKQLLYWGQKELKKRCRPRKTVRMQVTDIRTVAGHEHEVFDINDIVQAYYHDSQDNSEHIEELRVVYWQYNVFAMWDCTVELGDKTSNLTEIFELIYNKSKNSPNANGSGQISSSSVTLTPSSDSTTVAGQWGIISQTTTDNSNAIAGLIIDTSANYSYAHLFAQYQKQTAQALTQAYAGLEFYADAKMAQAKLESRFHTENYVTGAVTEAYAGFKAYADENYAQISALATYEYKDKNGTIFTMAGLQSYVDNEVARNELIASFTKNGIENYAGLISEVKETIAKNELIAAFTDPTGKKTSYAMFRQEVRDMLASNSVIAMFEREDISNMSLFQQYVEDYWAGYDLIAQFRNANIENLSQLVAYADKNSAYSALLSSFDEKNIDSLAGLVNYVDSESASSTLMAQFGKAVAYVEAISSSDGAAVNIYGNVTITSGKTFYYGDADFFSRVGWTRIHTSKGDGAVLGFWGQGTINIPDGYMSGGYALTDNGWDVIRV